MHGNFKDKNGVIMAAVAVIAALVISFVLIGTSSNNGKHEAGKVEPAASASSVPDSTASSSDPADSGDLADQTPFPDSQFTAAPAQTTDSAEFNKDPVSAAIDFLTNNSAAQAVLTDIPQKTTSYEVHDLSAKADQNPKMEGIYTVSGMCSIAKDMTFGDDELYAGDQVTVQVIIGYDGTKSIVHSATAGAITILDDGYFDADMLKNPTLFMPTD